MDLKIFYQKVRQLEAKITQPFVVIVSLETPDGGRPGVLTEVSRPLAARLVTEGKAELAGEGAAREFRARNAEAKQKAEEAVAASRLQVTIVSDAEWRALRGGGKKGA
jgi:hypothetical protein